MNSEKLFDVLPYVVDIYEKLDFEKIQNDVKEINTKEKNEKAIEKVGMKIIMHVLKNSAKVKEEFFGIVAIMQDKTIKEVKEQNFKETIKVFHSIPE